MDVVGVSAPPPPPATMPAAAPDAALDQQDPRRAAEIAAAPPARLDPAVTEQLTDAVIRGIDRRMTSWRERLS